MEIYNYHEYTREFLSTSVADESPLEPGVYHIPANATTIQPPEHVEGKTRNFVNGNWVYVDIPQETKPEIDPLFNSYVYQRQLNYPSIGDQLDALFHAGVFPPEMAAQIQAVKDQFPKTVS